MQTAFNNFFVVKDKEELEYLGDSEYIIWNDKFIKSAALVDTSHYRQFPEFLSKALDWKLALESMYPLVKAKCLETYGYYTEKPLMYAEDRYIKHLIEDYIIVKTNKVLDLDIQLYYPNFAFRDGYKDAYHRLSKYNGR